ncbi:hypothetical protein [Actinoplanes subtropicus]|uniref:hypothetical protein n=1 Tax=Actinoplanes subtropicus TaxID=543632 RepID=UPI0004C32AFC|nr:hypothetical protein [Actinoplanes subtropicus]
MRKLWYAGAVVAGGIFLFGAAVPAQADLLPGTGTAEQQADEQLTDLLGQSNGLNVENPLRYSTIGNTPLGSQPVMNFKSGQNTPDLNPVLPGESGHLPRPALGNTELPDADVIGAPQRLGNALPTRTKVHQNLPLQSLPVVGQLFGGLLPSGGTPSLLQRPTDRQTELFDGGMPLLGGLGGGLPANQLPEVPGVPNVSGLPAGGFTVAPAVAAPAHGKPKPAVTPDDPRLHEEPLDTDATPSATLPTDPRREFSPNGRPVAGIDDQYR